MARLKVKLLALLAKPEAKILLLAALAATPVAPLAKGKEVPFL